MKRGGGVRPGGEYTSGPITGSDALGGVGAKREKNAERVRSGCSGLAVGRLRRPPGPVLRSGGRGRKTPLP